MEYAEITEAFVPMGSGEPRSNVTGKPHLTLIIKGIEKSVGFDYKGAGFENMDLTMDIGFMWEEVLSRVFADRMAIRPGEVECDNIVGSPDGINSDPGVVENNGHIIIEPDDSVMVLEEYKFTWKSSKTLPHDNWYFMTQAKGYCYMVGTNIIIFRVCYVNGNYKGSGPQYRVERIVYTDYELKANWDMILDFAERKGYFKGEGK